MLRLVSAGDDIKIWDCNDFLLEHQFNPHDQNITSVCWACDNSFLASASVHTENVVLTDARTWDKSILKCEMGVMCLDVNDTSRYMLNGASSGVISVWDLKTRKVRKTYKEHKGPVTCARFNQGTTSIASGSETGEIILYNVVTGQGCRPMTTPSVQAIKQVQYGRKKSQLGSVSDDGAVSLWDCNTRQLVHTFSCHRAPATGLSFSPINDIFLVSVGLDKRIVCHDIQTKKVVKVINTDSPLTSVDTMSNGISLAVGSTRGQIFHYDLRMGFVPLLVLDAHKSSVQGLKFQMEVKGETLNSKPKSSTGNQHLKHRQLPASPRTVGNIQHEMKTPVTGVDMDVFSPLREGFQEHSNEDSENRNSDGMPAGNPAKEWQADIYSGGVLSPLHEQVGRGSSGAGLSPLAFQGFTPRSTQKQNSPVLSSLENRMNIQTTVPTVNIVSATPQDHDTSNGMPTYTGLTNGMSTSHHMTSEAVINQMGTDIPRERTPAHQPKQVAFLTEEPDTYIFSSNSNSPSHSNNDSHSPESSRLSQNQQIGMSASPCLPTMHYGDSPGSAYGGVNGASLQHYPTTPDGVNAQSLVPSDVDLKPRPVRKHVSDDKYATVDEETITKIVRKVVQEEFCAMKKELVSVIKDSNDDTVDSLHRDIMNLQSTMLVEFLQLQNELIHLLEQYSVNPDMVAEINRLQEENKRLKRIY
ncbi:protein NEDD1-like [Dreissena polymorpha]|nr:protein NEDD1-like [Dreissena polymorpha]XP_052283919.1 protein NEDD1-like [Dreissena polymorpha]